MDIEIFSILQNICCHVVSKFWSLYMYYPSSCHYFSNPDSNVAFDNPCHLSHCHSTVVLRCVPERDREECSWMSRGFGCPRVGSTLNKVSGAAYYYPHTLAANDLRAQNLSWREHAPDPWAPRLSQNNISYATAFFFVHAETLLLVSCLWNVYHSPSIAVVHTVKGHYERM